MPQRIAIAKVPESQSILPGWVRALSQGGTGPGDLAGPIEAPFAVAAQSPALMRKLGEALLERLKTRGDVPEHLMQVLSDMQRRWPRVFGHIDDVKIDHTGGPLGAALGSSGNRVDEGLIPQRLPTQVRDIMPPEVPHSAVSGLKEKIDAARKEMKYSTIRLNPALIEGVTGSHGMAEVPAHELVHSAQRILDPMIDTKYFNQLDQATALPNMSRRQAYNAVTYEGNAQRGGNRYAAEYLRAKARGLPSKELVQQTGRAVMPGVPSVHPGVPELQMRDALLKLMKGGPQ